MPLFHTHIIVDWSARSKPSPAKPSRDSIWWATARDGRVQAPQYARTRHDAIDRLASVIAAELDASRRVLASFDFPFGYPAGVARHLTGKASALDLWDWFEDRIEDAENNANNRYEVAAEINRTYRGLGPFWGRPKNWPYPDVPTRKSDRTHHQWAAHPPECRIADRHAKGAKTIWQLAYAGCVGSQVLLGLPALNRLTADPRVRSHAAIWPFQTGLRAPQAPVVIAEIYPSLLQQEAHKRQGKILDAAQVCVNAEAFARLDALDGLAPCFEGAPNLTPDERRCIETEEAWILGLGHEDALRNALDSV